MRLVTIELQIHPALARVCHRRHTAVFPAFNSFNANHVRAMIAQQSGAIRACNEAAKI
jgi:hypothetical protein